MAGHHAPTARRAGRSAVVLALATLALIMGATACGGSPQAEVEVVKESRDPVTHEYVIPYGTANRLAGGEKVEIVPQKLKVKVGDTIRIVNQDSFGSQVGIFHVGAGETVTMKFTTPGTLTGACDVHPSGEFTIDVRDA
jgi:plastocyanin